MPTTASSALNSIAATTNHTPDTIARIALNTMTTAGDPDVSVLIAQHGAEDALRILGSAQGAVVDMSVRRIQRRMRTIPTVQSIAAVIRAADGAGLSVVTPPMPLWPAGLNDLGDAAPILLWVDGDPAALIRPAIVVTGNRRATPQALHCCLDLASTLASRGYAIASTTNTGVDTASLLAALAVGGTPIAVTARDLAHPDERTRLTNRVAAGGAVVFEVPPGAPPDRRNGGRLSHLLAGLAIKAVIIDGTLTSAAVSVAEASHELGRPIGVLPPRTQSDDAASFRYVHQNLGAEVVMNADDAEWMHLRPAIAVTARGW
ncbi:DNA-processing protein DprA [Marisediminicola senii]|uniref:DNA-processing protein DprA n=1 Tax=Marisediminicola senii TaxID=2711233 RepID=UPI0013ED8FE1|nr:DNA-processing protein DprA [Marisediminicola senii]